MVTEKSRQLTKSATSLAYAVSKQSKLPVVQSEAKKLAALLLSTDEVVSTVMKQRLVEAKLNCNDLAGFARFSGKPACADALHGISFLIETALEGLS